ncbi:ankyrin [Auriscalpium vulgare]|uniref:Ankyrin n=1 Tax=Auriscalpium vulgare TaxID=40419 RepID=A0ACB8R9I9_9AGAM|nr:ankyrin [Auriscalpium vulgare]
MSSPNGPYPSPSLKAISNPLFDKAVQNHLQRLQAWELDDFVVSTPEGVRSVVAEYHSTHTKSRLLRCIQRISRVIAPLEKFFSAVDDGVSSHPEVAGITALHVAATRRNGWSLIPLKLILDHGSDAHAKDNEGRTALHHVERDHDAEIMEKAVPILMRWGADVNARDHNGSTPLLAACSLVTPGLGARLDAVRVLLEHGASGSVVDGAGKTALYIFAEDSRRWGSENMYDWWRVLEKLLQMLLAHGADPHIIDSSGRRAADYAQFAELYLFLQGAVGEEPGMDKVGKLPVATPVKGHKYVFT